jgi:hypothetical protein
MCRAQDAPEEWRLQPVATINPGNFAPDVCYSNARIWLPFEPLRGVAGSFDVDLDAAALERSEPDDPRDWSASSRCQVVRSLFWRAARTIAN